MTRKKKNIHVATITAIEIFEMRKPLHNGYSCGYGIHDDKKYNRRKIKEQLRKEEW